MNESQPKKTRKFTSNLSFNTLIEPKTVNTSIINQIKEKYQKKYEENNTTYEDLFNKFDNIKKELLKLMTRAKGFHNTVNQQTNYNKLLEQKGEYNTIIKEFNEYIAPAQEVYESLQKLYTEVVVNYENLRKELLQINVNNEDSPFKELINNYKSLIKKIKEIKDVNIGKKILNKMQELKEDWKDIRTDVKTELKNKIKKSLNQISKNSEIQTILTNYNNKTNNNKQIILQKYKSILNSFKSSIEGLTNQSKKLNRKNDNANINISNITKQLNEITKKLSNYQQNLSNKSSELQTKLSKNTQNNKKEILKRLELINNLINKYSTISGKTINSESRNNSKLSPTILGSTSPELTKENLKKDTKIMWVTTKDGGEERKYGKIKELIKRNHLEYISVQEVVKNGDSYKLLNKNSLPLFAIDPSQRTDKKLKFYSWNGKINS